MIENRKSFTLNVVTECDLDVYKVHYLRKLMLISSENPNTRHYLKSTDAISQEQLRHIRSPRHVWIHPFSIFRWYWESILTWMFLTYFLCKPYRVFIFARDPNNIKPVLFDHIILVVQMFFLVDMIIIFNTGRYSVSSYDVKMDKMKIAKDYLSGYFVFDLISSLPIDYLCLCVTPSMINLWLLAEFLFIFKFVRYPTFLKYFGNLVRKIFKSHSATRFLKVGISSFIVIHCTACFYNSVVTWSHSSGNMDPYMWTRRLRVPIENASERYIYGLLFVLSNLITCCLLEGTGYGLNPPISVGDLVVFGIIMVLVGMYRLYCFVIMSEEIMTLSSGTNQNLEMMNQIKEYMRQKGLPLATQERFIEYYEYRFKKQYFRENTLLSLLSAQLRAGIVLYTCKNLTINPLFENATKSAVGAVLASLHYEVYLPTDVIIKAGSIGDCMYFISRGTVAIYTPTGKEVTHLADGEYFGEAALIMKDCKRVATVVALETTELYRLDQKDFRELIATNEVLLAAVEATATARMNRTILHEKLHTLSHPQD